MKNSSKDVFVSLLSRRRLGLGEFTWGEGSTAVLPKMLSNSEEVWEVNWGAEVGFGRRGLLVIADRRSGWEWG